MSDSKTHSTHELMKELIAAAEDVARSVKLTPDDWEAGYARIRTPKATRLINAVSAVLAKVPGAK